MAAARRLFAERGYSVPLNAIAKVAGVSQGVLYRHFPSRIALAVAVFEENFAELETLAGEPSPDAFERFFARLVELTVESLGFVELAVGARETLVDYQGEARLRRLTEESLARARQAGRVRSDLVSADVLLGLQMIYGVAVTAVDDAGRRASVLRTMEVLAAWWELQNPGPGGDTSAASIQARKQPPSGDPPEAAPRAATPRSSPRAATIRAPDR